jgi:hypothetical protein
MKLLWGLVLAVLCSGFVFSLVLSVRPKTPLPPAPPTAAAPPPIQVPLTVPVGTPLTIALDKDVRIRKVGQPVEGRLVEPVYAFDKLVIPAGAKAEGTISQIGGVPGKTRVLAAMNADFSPSRRVRITFRELQLPDGRRIPVNTEVSPASAGVLHLVAVSASAPGKMQAARNAVSRRIAAARQQLRSEIQLAKSELKAPGKFHRLERLGLSELPYRPQYMDAGATFNAELQQPLAFGQEVLSPDAVSLVGTPPAAAAFLHAKLLTPLSSATSRRGQQVEAVVTQPLFASTGPHKLLVPEGSRLQGTVLQAVGARRFSRNGLLRVEFKQLVLPAGAAEQVAASLAAVEVAQQEHLKLDSEGGAQMTNPPSRYLRTALSVALAASTASPEHDRDANLHGGADAGNGAAAGASGFRLVGTILGTFAHSRVLSTGLSFYGAGMSVYSHFLARGREVVYPRDMSMLVGLAPGQQAAHVSKPR